MKTHINIAILGESRCGKSSIIKCFLSNEFQEKTSETIINIYTASFEIDENNIDVNFL